MATLAQACRTQFGWESKMADAINAGDDLHRVVAARVTGKEPEAVTLKERAQAKPINFGKPGGMGDRAVQAYARLSYGVDLTDDEVAALSGAWFDAFPEMRRFLADESEQTWARVAAELGLTAADHAARTGDERFLRRAESPRAAAAPNKYLGAMCLKTAADPAPVTRAGRAYSDADREYFWGKIAAVADQLPAMFRRTIALREPGFGVKWAVRALCDRAGVYTLTGRLRAATGYCQRHNTVFQGLAADGAKLGLWKVWRAGYRVVNFIHDEVLVEVPAGADLTAHAARIVELLVAGMKAVVPDVTIKVETVAMTRWSKAAVATYNASGGLVAWSEAAA